MKKEKENLFTDRCKVVRRRKENWFDHWKILRSRNYPDWSWSILVSNRLLLLFTVPESVEDHGEENEFTEERHYEWRRWDDLGQQEEEHSQRQ